MDTSDVGRHARSVGDNKYVERFARVGYAANGVLHLLIGWIAIRLATSSGGGSADQSGALGMLADNPFGVVALWIGLIGWAGLALWQLAEALMPFLDAKDRIKAASKFVLYVALSWTCWTFISGVEKASSSQTQGATQSALNLPGGPVLVGIAGLVVIGVGIYHVVKGARSKFLDDLVKDPGEAVRWAGRIGYVAKGIALVIVGILFGQAALQERAGAARGLDGAMRAILEQPFGAAMLIAVGLGFIMYAVYSVGRARWARV